MPLRPKKRLLDRIGSWIAELPAGQVFGLGLFGFLVFTGVTLLGVTTGFTHLANTIDAGREPADKTPAPAPILDFPDLVVKTTGAAYSAFFDLSLSKINFISNYVVPKEAGDRKWDYTYWELWVPKDFDFETARRKFDEKVARLSRTVRVEGQELDSKTYRINVDIEGLNTHRVFLTRTAMESEKGAEAMYVLADIQEKVPEKKYTGPPRVAIIIDDIGFRDVFEQQILALDAPITFSVLPFTPYGQNFARRAHMKGREVMLHLPMEAIDALNRPGQGGLFVRMTAPEIKQATAADLDWVPDISGVNNHMGSRFTSNEDKMTAVLEQIRDRALYFIDSRTIESSRAYDTAKRMGVRTSVRNVFLDHDPQQDKIRMQFDVLAAIAKRQGTAIAIGHPNDNTLTALREKLAEFAREGIRVVPPSELVN